MTKFPYVEFDPLLPAREAAEMVGLCERFGSYRTYSEETVDSEIGAGLPQRYDAAANFVKTGGRFGRREPTGALARRTNYFRESYAYGEEVLAPGIEPFLHHAGFSAAARELHGRPLIEPAIVYANLYLPGQELAIHTDVPEFRGANRKKTPQWLLVAMHHSALFEPWRMPIATAVAFFHDCKGGEFAFYPDGPDAPALALRVHYNTAVLIDTDSVFHGVDRVASPSGEPPPIEPGMRLRFEGKGRWSVGDGERMAATYRWEEMRFSISWKAYCFRDEAERAAWAEHRDDLENDAIVERMVEDLRARGRLNGERPQGRELALLLIDEYIRFPAPSTA